MDAKQQGAVARCCAPNHSCKQVPSESAHLCGTIFHHYLIAFNYFQTLPMKHCDLSVKEFTASVHLKLFSSFPMNLYKLCSPASSIVKVSHWAANGGNTHGWMQQCSVVQGALCSWSNEVFQHINTPQGGGQSLQQDQVIIVLETGLGFSGGFPDT